MKINFKFIAGIYIAFLFIGLIASMVITSKVIDNLYDPSSKIIRGVNQDFLFTPEQKKIAIVTSRDAPATKVVGLWNGTNLATQEQIEEENRLGDMELLAQIAQAEAGNQGIDGMRYVISVVLNRVRSPRFPNTIEGVIFQKWAFGPITDGNWDKAAWHMSPEAFEAVRLEMEEGQIDTNVLFFNTTWVNGRNPFRVGSHWFSS